jgi:hypothetical protein
MDYGQHPRWNHIMAEALTADEWERVKVDVLTLQGDGTDNLLANIDSQHLGEMRLYFGGRMADIQVQIAELAKVWHVCKAHWRKAVISGS